MEADTPYNQSIFKHTRQTTAFTTQTRKKDPGTFPNSRLHLSAKRATLQHLSQCYHLSVGPFSLMRCTAPTRTELNESDENTTVLLLLLEIASLVRIVRVLLFMCPRLLSGRASSGDFGKADRPRNRQERFDGRLTNIPELGQMS